MDRTRTPNRPSSRAATLGAVAIALCLGSQPAQAQRAITDHFTIFYTNSSYLYAGGPIPPGPRRCGFDPTADGLDCAAYRPCSS